MDFKVVAEGLMFPEGPLALDDGSIAVVEIAGACLTRTWGDGRKERIAELQGGPNGAALGPDGFVYICNNGGMGWRQEGSEVVPTGVTPQTYAGGYLERVDLSTGRSERVVETIDGERLHSPNDLVFDRDGGLWFTDFGKNLDGQRTPGGICYLPPGGAARRLIGGAYTFNGVGLSPDERTLYVAETHGARLLAYAIPEPGVLAADLPREVCAVGGTRGFDSLAVGLGGEVYVGGITPGGLFVIDPAGAAREEVLPDPFVTNVCFGGEGLAKAYVTLSQSGLLVECLGLGPGLPLNFGPR